MCHPDQAGVLFVTLTNPYGLEEGRGPAVFVTPVPERRDEGIPSSHGELLLMAESQRAANVRD
jgi:hypothetical protein